MKKIEKLVCFDFDGTLCDTPEADNGKKIWFEKTGTSWPHRGWWGRKESLDMDVFDIGVNPWVYSEYLKAVSDESVHLILATGRLETLRKEVEDILNSHNLSFDGVYLNWGTDTFKYKTKLFESLIQKLGVSEFTMYDDRESHLINFEQWAQTQSIQVTVVNINTKEKKTFNKKNI
jgi:FMN phosphatase YigB (HAD superfamily)